MPKGVDDHFIVAASAIKNMLAILHDTNELTYAPGPMNLPGGYPVRLSLKGSKVELPEDISLDEAVQINEESQRLDGIEKIESDGTVIFTEKTVKIMKEMLGYECEKLRLEECGKKAKELLSAYKNRYRR